MTIVLYCILNNLFSNDFVVITDKAEIKEAPNYFSTTITKIEFGAEGKIIDFDKKVVSNYNNTNVWYKVNYLNKLGWVYGDNIGFFPRKTQKNLYAIKKNIKKIDEGYGGIPVTCGSSDLLIFDIEKKKIIKDENTFLYF